MSVISNAEIARKSSFLLGRRANSDVSFSFFQPILIPPVRSCIRGIITKSHFSIFLISIIVNLQWVIHSHSHHFTTAANDPVFRPVGVHLSTLDANTGAKITQRCIKTRCTPWNLISFKDFVAKKDKKLAIAFLMYYLCTRLVD